MKTGEHKASGCLFGLAFGDSLGSQTEFLSIEEILRRFPPSGPTQPQGKPALVTDDTQMAIAVGEALLDVNNDFSPASVELALQKRFVNWFLSPDNNRAPGRTCLDACKKLFRNRPWQEATVKDSKGCGANMRVPPVGLLTRLSNEERAAIAQLQAVMTHGHPTALAASDLTAYAVNYLINDGNPNCMLKELREYAESQITNYHLEWLGDFWKKSAFSSGEEFISKGWHECLGVIDKLELALKKSDCKEDPCAITGDGWIAEEAFATGLFCFLMYETDPVAAVRFAATSSGDSDSIAALTGAFAGAHLGMAWPADWIERIEYRDILEQLGSAWDNQNISRS